MAVVIPFISLPERQRIQAEVINWLWPSDAPLRPKLAEVVRAAMSHGQFQMFQPSTTDIVHFAHICEALEGSDNEFALVDAYVVSLRRFERERGLRLESLPCAQRYIDSEGGGAAAIRVRDVLGRLALGWQVHEFLFDCMWTYEEYDARYAKTPAQNEHP